MHVSSKKGGREDNFLSLGSICQGPGEVQPGIQPGGSKEAIVKGSGKRPGYGSVSLNKVPLVLFLSPGVCS